MSLYLHHENRLRYETFCRLSSKYGFEKPNDRRALNLMNAAATAVLKELPDIICAYGVSDEFRQVKRWDQGGFP